MEEFISKLGIDWRLLASQIVNFLVLIAVLRAFAYKPILKILKERRAKIEEGLAKASEADVRLREIDELAKGKMKDAEQGALGLLRATEEKAKKVEQELLSKARERETAMMKSTEAAIEGKKEESRRAMEREAAELVKRVLVKTVELAPHAIDEALIKKAIHEAKRTS